MLGSHAGDVGEKMGSPDISSTSGLAVSLGITGNTSESGVANGTANSAWNPPAAFAAPTIFRIDVASGEPLAEESSLPPGKCLRDDQALADKQPVAPDLGTAPVGFAQ